MSNPYESPSLSQSEEAPDRVEAEGPNEALRAVFAFALMTLGLTVVAIAVFALGIARG